MVKSHDTVFYIVSLLFTSVDTWDKVETQHVVWNGDAWTRYLQYRFSLIILRNIRILKCQWIKVLFSRFNFLLTKLQLLFSCFFFMNLLIRILIRTNVEIIHVKCIMRIGQLCDCVTRKSTFSTQKWNPNPDGSCLLSIRHFFGTFSRHKKKTNKKFAFHKASELLSIIWTISSATCPSRDKYLEKSYYQCKVYIGYFLSKIVSFLKMADILSNFWVRARPLYGKLIQPKFMCT